MRDQIDHDIDMDFGIFDRLSNMMYGFEDGQYLVDIMNDIIIINDDRVYDDPYDYGRSMICKYFADLYNLLKTSYIIDHINLTEYKYLTVDVTTLWSAVHELLKAETKNSSPQIITLIFLKSIATSLLEMKNIADDLLTRDDIIDYIYGVDYLRDIESYILLAKACCAQDDVTAAMLSAVVDPTIFDEDSYDWKSRMYSSFKMFGGLL